jgi:hypothetical protein
MTWGKALHSASLSPSDGERVGVRGLGIWRLDFSIFAASSRRDDD